MQRFCIICLMLVIPFSLGCSRVFQNLFAEQTWSENYGHCIIICVKFRDKEYYTIDDSLLQIEKCKLQISNCI
jgi:hypothetical protein